jgi:nucleotide-binding universal stress UspA family protein
VSRRLDDVVGPADEPVPAVGVASYQVAGEVPAVREGSADGASLQVLSAWVFLENVGSMATMFDGADRLAADRATATARLVAPVRRDFPDLTVTEHVVRAGSTSEALVAVTAGADVIVIGSRRRSHSISSPLGHVTHAVLHHAHCPIVLVPILDHFKNLFRTPGPRSSRTPERDRWGRAGSDCSRGVSVPRMSVAVGLGRTTVVAPATVPGWSRTRSFRGTCRSSGQSSASRTSDRAVPSVLLEGGGNDISAQMTFPWGV